MRSHSAKINSVMREINHCEWKGRLWICIIWHWYILKRGSDRWVQSKVYIEDIHPYGNSRIWSISNHAHMCYLHLDFSGSNSPLKSWNQSLYAWCHPWTVAEQQWPLCMWQRWFTRRADGMCERQRSLPVEWEKKCNKAAASSRPLGFYGVNSLPSGRTLEGVWWRSQRTGRSAPWTSRNCCLSCSSCILASKLAILAGLAVASPEA